MSADEVQNLRAVGLAVAVDAAGALFQSGISDQAEP